MAARALVSFPGVEVAVCVCFGGCCRRGWRHRRNYEQKRSNFWRWQRWGRQRWRKPLACIQAANTTHGEGARNLVAMHMRPHAVNSVLVYPHRRRHPTNLYFYSLLSPTRPTIGQAAAVCHTFQKECTPIRATLYIYKI
jgi:hypothetical protein